MTTPSIDHDLPLSLRLHQSVDLPLPGHGASTAPTWRIESHDPAIARVLLTSTTDPVVTWHVNIRGEKPGKTTIHVAELGAPRHRHALTLEVQVLTQEQETGALLLVPDGPENQLKIGGDLGWFETASNGSIGTGWTFTPDSSGVYELADAVVLAQRPLVPGQGISTWWQLRGVKEGHAHAVFQRYFRGELAETVKIAITVVK